MGLLNFNRLKVWGFKEALASADLNGEFDNLAQGIGPTTISGASTDVTAMGTAIDPGSTGNESLASTIAGELQRLRFAISRIVGKSVWYDAPDFDLAGTLGTANLADGLITQAKRAALPYTLSSSCGNFTTTSTTPVDVTNLNVSRATTGRPVWIGLVTDGTNSAGVNCNRSSTVATCEVRFLRSTTVISTQYLTTGVSSGGILSIGVPNTSFSYVDFGASAGTTTYKVQLNVPSGGTAGIDNAKLLVYEL